MAQEVVKLVRNAERLRSVNKTWKILKLLLPPMSETDGVDVSRRWNYLCGELCYLSDDTRHAKQLCLFNEEGT